MNEKQFHAFMKAQVKVIRCFIASNPGMSPQEATIFWIKKYAKEFAERWRNNELDCKTGDCDNR